MLYRRFCRRIITAIVLLFFYVCIAYAQEDDSFGPSRKIAGKNFTIYYAPQLDIYRLTQQLNIQPSDEILTGRTIKRGSSSDAGLADTLDTLFTRVCDILDMNLYSFQGNVKICRDYNQLAQLYNNFFEKDLRNEQSFYVHSLNTIYISADNFKLEILGHEIAHAVISHYFVVLPSVKIQEVLAGYVEYQLRKSGQ